MMQRIRNAFLQIDIFVVAAAVLLITLYGFIIEKDRLVTTVILSSAIVVLTAVIGIRYRLDDVLSRLPKNESVHFLDSLPDDFVGRLLDAREILISGIHQYDFFTQYRKEIEMVATRNNTKLRVLLVAPGGAASKMTAKRFPTHVKEEDLISMENGKILHSLRFLGSVQSRSNNRDFVIKTYDFLLPYGTVLLDPSDTFRSILYLEHYTFRTRGGAKKPKTVHRGADEWYTLVHSEFEEMWKSATIYNHKED
jgi:hypothetical protein